MSERVILLCSTCSAPIKVTALTGLPASARILTGAELRVSATEAELRVSATINADRHDGSCQNDEAERWERRARALRAAAKKLENTMADDDRRVPHWRETEAVIAELRAMTPEQVRQTFVRSGILTPEGKVTAEYGGEPEILTAEWIAELRRDVEAAPRLQHAEYTDVWFRLLDSHEALRAERDWFSRKCTEKPHIYESMIAELTALRARCEWLERWKAAAMHAAPMGFECVRVATGLREACIERPISDPPLCPQCQLNDLIWEALDAKRARRDV